MSEKMRVVVVDDHPLFREGVAHMLSMEHDIDIVGQGATAPSHTAASRDATSPPTTPSLVVEHSIGVRGGVTTASGSLVITDFLGVAGGVTSEGTIWASPKPRIRVTILVRASLFSRRIRPSFCHPASVRRTWFRSQFHRCSRHVMAGSQVPAGRPLR